MEASPFFATRVEGKIETWIARQQHFSFFPLPLRLAVLSLLLVATTAVYSLHFVRHTQSLEEQYAAYYIEEYAWDVEMHDLASVY
jgi:hypothetical protein